MIKTNYLIVGSGVAGLTLALKIANQFPEKTVTIVTKATADESNTKYAQGGIAIVTDKIGDSYNKHIEDTIICGDGLCDPEVVEMVINEGPKRLKELIEWGAMFDKNIEGTLDLGKEGGHSENRVVHHKDQTGKEIERAILSQVQLKTNIDVLPHHFSIDLITKDNRCLGAHVLNQKTKDIITFSSDFTVLATGGIGHLYGHTTNPVIATGDGIAMAYRVNAEIRDMEFIQFHPTSLYTDSTGPSFLISEAVRGFGAHLRTKNGHLFMPDYDVRGDLASRDIVSQSIEKELAKTGDECVYLDCTHLDMEAFIKHFPMIYNRCKMVGFDLAKDWIPVVPAQHYICGGIAVDQSGKTSVENLFACGECSRTGLHGANRLASNSLLEALVYSDNIYDYWSENEFPESQFEGEVKDWGDNKKSRIDVNYITETKEALQLLMRQNAGIVRNDHDLKIAQTKLEELESEVKKATEDYQVNANLWELYNLVIIGKIIVNQSIARKDNRGGFVKTDNTL
ncbi:L-aspartate oxidase [Flavobacterium algicola]|uniref:L-aspartate oxidase n=1 Tax=Flavobacterium algicola TaxID=556529 RepID=UPI001EFD8124|nr:L-aspartate oxidase [Flavobacterium algicola]MCG9791260.1 L-aspartate oxidase [Flavobacterium algicola]